MDEGDVVAMELAMTAATFHRWTELRFNRTPTYRERHEFIRLVARRARAATDKDSIFSIDALSMTMPIAGVEAFAKKHGLFDALDRVERKKNNFQRWWEKMRRSWDRKAPS